MIIALVFLIVLAFILGLSYLGVKLATKLQPQCELLPSQQSGDNQESEVLVVKKSEKKSNAKRIKDLLKAAEFEDAEETRRLLSGFGNICYLNRQAAAKYRKEAAAIAKKANIKIIEE
jgi:hypothetical protein